MLGQTKKLVDMMRKEAGIKPARIGIGTPGVHDPKLGTMKNCNTVAMKWQADEKRS
jgi:fructokinase